MGKARRAEAYIEYRKKTLQAVAGSGADASGGGYYAQYTGKSIHIDEVFSAIGVEAQYTGSWKNRRPVAEANGISGYTGTYSQNVTLMGYAKAGTLKRPGGGDAVTQLMTTVSKTEATGFLAPYAESISYTDAADGQGDSLSITLDDRDGNFIGPWRPTEGMFLYVRIDTKDWAYGGDDRGFECGEFLVDDISCSGPPSACKISGVSVPQDQDFRSAKTTRTWEGTTFRQIAQEICNKYGLVLLFDAADIAVASIEQNGRTDCSFLYQMAQSYGYAMKAYSNRLVVYDIEAYEKKAAVASITPKECESYSFQESLYGAYTGAEVAFTDPNTEEDYSITIGEEGRTYEANVTADSLADLEKKGIAALNLQNRSALTASLKIFPVPGISAGQNVELSGFGAYDGKYAIESVKHSLSGSGGYAQTLSLCRIRDWIKTVSAGAVDAAAEAAAETVSYTVKAGDTLWAIAKEYLGAGKNYPQIYDDNKDVIEQTAKSHGKSSSDGGHWIWPGEVLTIHVAKEA